MAAPAAASEFSGHASSARPHHPLQLVMPSLARARGCGVIAPNAPALRRRLRSATMLQDRDAMRSRYGPILQPKTFDLRERPRVMRNEDDVRHMRVTSNERVERLDRPARAPKQGHSCDRASSAAEPVLRTSAPRGSSQLLCEQPEAQLCHRKLRIFRRTERRGRAGRRP